MLTNNKKISTIVPIKSLDIEGSNGEGTGKAYYNCISCICYGASVHDKDMYRNKKTMKQS